MLMLLDSVVDSDINGDIFDLQKHKFALVLKMASAKPSYFAS